jgi:hypothetical protein
MNETMVECHNCQSNFDITVEGYSSQYITLCKSCIATQRNFRKFGEKVGA